MSHPDTSFRWEVGLLPFLWRPLDQPTNGEGLPDSLPFTLTLDRATGTLVQEPRPDVQSALDRAYALGSTLSGVMEGRGIGKSYAEAFLGFLQETLGRNRFEGLRVLEVGCGTGYLLSRIRDLGAKVIGIEPGSHGQAAARDWGLEIVADYFPSPRVTGTFDLVVSYGVLEHVTDPVGFLRNLRGAVAENGDLVVAAPDCGSCIDLGDLSMFFHEHWSYFTEDTMRAALGLAGLSCTDFARGRMGDNLYAKAKSAAADSVRPEEIELRAARARNLRARAEGTARRIASYFEEAQRNGESVGVYVPTRFINYAWLFHIDTARLRFFDDNPTLWGKYFPGLPIPVEPGEDLVRRPTDRILIMSHPFGESIAARLAKASLHADRIDSFTRA